MTDLSFINKPQSQPIKYKSIIDVFNENASEFPEKEICIQRFPDGSRRPITYSDLKRKSMRTASYLVGQGIKVGDKVGIAGQNSIEWIIGELAILMAGAVSVHLPMFEGNFRKTLEGIQISECKSALLDPENDVKFLEDIEEYVSNNPSNERSGSENLVFVLLRKHGKSTLPDVESMEKSDESHTERKLPRIFPETTAIIL
ncbi:bacitracin synthase 1-like [Pecten maximus]|uniref:bacitracin synthase 1-like n=1 Tax=Pecten maximus TaxID=6579 RepID=UPI0014582B20|nr:bacitracin synthase 1-like [Pecten maximus]